MANRRIVRYDARSDPRDGPKLYWTKKFRMHNKRIEVGVASCGQTFIRTKRLIGREVHVSEVCYSPEAVACILLTIEEGSKRWSSGPGGEKGEGLRKGGA